MTLGSNTLPVYSRLPGSWKAGRPGGSEAWRLEGSEAGRPESRLCWKCGHYGNKRINCFAIKPAGFLAFEPSSYRNYRP